MELLSHLKRVRSDSDDSEFNSPEAKRIQLDLFDALEGTDVCTVGQDLDSFIKSFEDEIISPHPETADRTSDFGESRPDLEFLLEASDDELGLPPSGASSTESEGIPVSTESVELGVFSWLDDKLTNAFEYEFDYTDGDVNINGNNYQTGEYVALDGLFDYTDVGSGSAEVSRQPESLPA